MKLRSIRYYVNEAFIGLLRNRLMSFASILTVASCIFMLSVYFCLAINLNGILKQVESSIGLTVYIESSLDADHVNELFAKVKALENVKSVKYVSAEDALASFRADLKDNESILAGLDKDNPLPRSFNIDVSEAKYQEVLVQELEKLKSQGISEIRYQQHIVDALTAINNGVRIVSFVGIVVLVTVSIVIIMNTIRLTVNNRKVEINIMKYVGATDWFIRWPFIIEGMLIGLIGSVIPTVLSMLGYNKILNVIYDQIPMLQSIVEFVPSVAVFSTLIPLTLALGVLIGTIGSVSSIRRHLQV